MTINDKPLVLKSLISKNYQYRAALSLITSQFLVFALINLGIKKIEYGSVILISITIIGLLVGLFFYYRSLNIKLSDAKFKLYHDLIE